MNKLLPLLLLTTTSCSGVGRYFVNRGLDLADCFQLNGGVGYGLAANVKGTDALTFYVGHAKTDRYGLGRRYIENWKEEETGFFISGIREVRSKELNDRLDERINSLVLVVDTFELFDDFGRPRVEMANLEMGGTVGMISFRAGFSPGQFLDFLVGIVGFDPAGDDLGKKVEE